MMVRTRDGGDCSDEAVCAEAAVGTVPRRRLSQQLKQAMDARLTLVSAPAGFGKTTLLATALQDAADEKRIVAWLSLDPNDNDPAP